MGCVKSRGRLLSGTVSGGSINWHDPNAKMSISFCNVAWNVGITGLSGGQVHSGVAGLLVAGTSIFGWELRCTFRSFAKM